MARKSIGRRFTDEDKEKFEEGVQLSLNEFYAISSDHAAEALRCGANMKISWTRSDGKVFTARDRLVEFNIYRAEGPGKVVFVTNESGSIAQTLETMFAD
ncbi:MAG: hypothetical protein QOD26_3826 [Betaproteobacteria bacterium]|nr:hypothetical protein [Betaproteobacteria bacterium]